MTTDVVVAERPTPRRAAAVPVPALRAAGARQRARADRGPPARVARSSRPRSCCRAAPSTSPPSPAGVTSLMARALTEGTAHHDAIGLTEASERLGASLHAEAGWDGLSVSVEVPAERLSAALALAAEVAIEPTFPAARCRAAAGRAPERPAAGEGRPSPPCRRRRSSRRSTRRARPTAGPPAGTEETVPRLDAAACRAHPRAAASIPARMTLIIGGDLDAVGGDVRSIAESRFGAWARNPAAEGADEADGRGGARRAARPRDPSTGLRADRDPRRPRRACRRLIPDFHAMSVMSAILGGLFNSRLNRKLREEKGYTYGAGAGFDMRRGAGPFAVRAAVNTEVTVPAIQDILAELDGDARRAADRRRAPRGARLPRRRVPAPVRDAAGRRRRDRRPAHPGAAAGRAGSIPAGDRGRRAPSDVESAARATSARTSSRSCSSATPTRSCRRSRAPRIGPIVVEREELPGQGAPVDAA